MSNWLILVLPLFLLIPTTAFAIMPTPYNEWDFSFVTTEVYQDTENPTILNMDSQIIFHGSKDYGSVKINADVVEPDGNIKSYSTHFFDLEIDETAQRSFVHNMNKTGMYKVIMKMTPPSEPFVYHVFEEKTFEIKIIELEKKLDTIRSESDDLVSYNLVNPELISSNDVVHVTILDDSFASVVVTNNSTTVKEFSSDISNIYLTTNHSWNDLKINLIKQNTIIPSAHAASFSNQELKFSVSTPFFICDIHDECLNIESLDNALVSDSGEDNLIWFLVMFGFSIIVFLFLKKIKHKNKWGKPHIEIIKN